MSSNSNSFGVSAISRVFNDSSSDVRGKVIGIYTFLLIFNVVAWILALVTFARVPGLLGLAVIAYTFGLRHSVDADHISAIDNELFQIAEVRRFQGKDAPSRARRPIRAGDVLFSNVRTYRSSSKTVFLPFNRQVA